MSALAVIRPGDRVKYRLFYGIPNRDGVRDCKEAWGRVMIKNRDGSVVLDGGGRYGRPVVINQDEQVIKVSTAR